MTIREKLALVLRIAKEHTDTVEGSAVFGEGRNGRALRSHTRIFLAAACAAREEKQAECKSKLTEYALSLLAYILRVAEESCGLCDDDARAAFLYGTTALGDAITEETRARIAPYTGLPPFEAPMPPDLSENEPRAAIELLMSVSLPLLLRGGVGHERESFAPLAERILPTLLPDGRTLLHLNAPNYLWLAALLLLARDHAPILRFAIRFAETVPLPDEAIETERYELLLSTLAVLLALVPNADSSPAETTPPFLDEYDGGRAILVRGKQREAALLGYRRAMLLLPSDASAFIDGEAVTRFSFYGAARYKNERLSLLPYKGGFLSYTQERVLAATDGYASPAATLFCAVAVLPDDETALRISFCRCDASARISAFDDCLWRLSPDPSRIYYYGDAKRTLGTRAEHYTSVGSYFNIADRIGVVSQSPMTVTADKDGRRALSLALLRSPARFFVGETVLHTAAAIAVGGIRRTRALADTFLTLDGLPRGILSVSAVAANRKRYTLLYNVTDTPFVWEDHTVAPETAVLLAWDR